MMLRQSLLVAAGCALSLALRPAYAAPEPASSAVASVDGVPVTRATFNQALEGLYGEQILPQLIDDQLLANALAARGLSVSDDEVNTALARFSHQDPTIKTAVQAGGVRADLVRYQIRRILISQKLLTARVAAPTDAQLQSFFATYGAYYGSPAQNELGLLATSTRARADQLVRALKANPGAFNSLVAQQKQRATSDPIAAQSVPNVGRFEAPDQFATSRGIPPQVVAPLAKALAAAKKGQILPLQAFTPSGPFLIVKIVDRQDPTNPTLTQLHDEVETDYKLAQVAQSEIKKNPRNPQSLAVNVTQVVEFMAQPNTQTGEMGAHPSLRDALMFILRSASASTLAYLRSHASVTVSDPSYSTVASQYKKQP